MNKFFIEINRLRAIAVLLVLIGHFPSLVRYISTQRFGDFWVGVDLFLVISGFVVANTFYNAYHKSGYNITTIYTFYYKRFYRIVPAMVAALAINIALFYIFKAFGYVDSWALDPISRLKGAVSILTFTANIFYGQKGILAPFDLGYFWTISLEWQFYCLFPIIIYTCLTRWSSRIITLFGLLIFINYLRYINVLQSPLIRYDGFIVGVIIFFIDYALRNKIVFFEHANILRKLYLLLLILSMIFLPRVIGGSFLLSFLAIISGAIIYLCSLDAGYLSYGKFINRILDYIGNRSYLIYLTHMTSFLIIRAFCSFVHLDISKGGFKQTAALLISYILVQVIIIELLARYIEKPGIKKAHSKLF